MNGFVKLINFWRLADTTIGFKAMSAFCKRKVIAFRHELSRIGIDSAN